MTTWFCPTCGAEYVEGAVECVDCGTPLDPAASDLGADDEGLLVYELPEWSEELRAELTRQLEGHGISHRWEGDDLAVDEADEARVDAIMDELDPLDETGEPVGDVVDISDDGDEDEAVDDEADWEAMSDLFDAADRLANAGAEDVTVAGGFVVAADAIVGRKAPYGVDGMLWIQIRRLAGSLSDELEHDAANVVIVRDAAKLRDLLRAFV